ncbi:MAG: radical SAM protein [Clostridiales bacterium]|nr:radical SAM protein [Clostridiales bacterium]
MAKGEYVAQKKALNALADVLIKYIYRDPKRNMLKLVSVAEKVTGNMYPSKTFDTARRIVTDETNIWNQFIFRGLEEIDHDTLRKALKAFGLDCGYFGTKTIRRNREVLDCNIPWVILMDPTSACNLKCKGCWSAEYNRHQHLTMDEMRSIVQQGKRLGTRFYMFTGGEPLIKKDEIFRLCEENPDCIFLAFTNGTLVDDAFCKRMRGIGNLTLSLSIEGNEATNDGRRGEGVYGKLMRAMDVLKENKCLFGLSICYTSVNYEAVTSDEFLDKMIEKGARFAWYFHYMPVGCQADTDLLLSPEQRAYIFRRIRQLRSSDGGKPLFTVDFQNDAEYVGGCIAGGRNYFHINSAGDIEPCVFVHYSDSNIREHTLLEALKRPLFMSYYRNQPFNDNMLRPCPMLENPQYLRQMVEKTGAKSTDLMQPEDVQCMCAKCDRYSQEWAPVAKSIWEEQERFAPYTQYYRDTPRGQAQIAQKGRDSEEIL